MQIVDEARASDRDISFNKAALTNILIGAYGLGSIATGIFSTVPTVLLLFYLTDILRISPGIATVVIFVPKLWSLAWDPLVGSWSDRSTTRLGQRTPFLICGTVGVSILFIILFSPAASLDRAQLDIWMGVSYFLFVSAYSLFAVPYVALPAELGTSARERSHLVSVRMLFAMGGVLIGSALAPTLVQAFGSGRTGYGHMSVILAVLSFVSMCAPILAVRGRDNVERRAKVTPLRLISTAAILRHRPFTWLVLTYVLVLTAATAMSSLVPYAVARAFGQQEGDIGLAFFIMMMATALSTPLWAACAQRIGNKATLIIGATIFICTSLCLGIAGWLPLSWSTALPFYGASGVSFGAIQVVPFIMLAETSHKFLSDKGSLNATLTGIWTASEKVALALGPAITGISLVAASGSFRILDAIVTTAALVLSALGAICANRCPALGSP